jgi:hypothetical protein
MSSELSDMAKAMPPQLKAALARALAIQQLGAATPLALMPYDISF